MKHFYMLLFFGIFFDAAMETIGINMGIFMYYGYQPYQFLGFPYWWGFVNSASFVTIGVMLWYAVPRLKGWNQLFILGLAPAGMGAAYFGVGWIHILAHNSELPHWARFVAATVMIANVLLYMRVLHHLAGAKEGQAVPNWTLAKMFAYCCLAGKPKQRILDQVTANNTLTTGAQQA